MFTAFIFSTGIVALAEMGDKTQLLALLLVSRYRRPWPIVAGIFAATLFNHALAGAAGAWATTLMQPHVLRWTLGLSFIVMAGWMMTPDRLDDDQRPREGGRWGVFGVALCAFFLAEMGDKTQIATLALAAQHSGHAGAVIMGTTLGMMLANAPVVFAGDRLLHKLPLRTVQMVCVGVFLALGLTTLLAGERLLPGG
ncbi:MAG: TMEM165/GDT1 family protein [Ottowia sp.]